MSNDALIWIIRAYKELGQFKDGDEIQAAVLRVKLRHLDDDVEHRRDVAARYYAELEVEKRGLIDVVILHFLTLTQSVA